MPPQRAPTSLQRLCSLEVSRQLVDGLVAGERVEAGFLPSTVGAGEHLSGANTSSGDLTSSREEGIPSSTTTTTTGTGDHLNGAFTSWGDPNSGSGDPNSGSGDPNSGSRDHLNGAFTSWGDPNSNATAPQSEQLLDSSLNQQREDSGLETKQEFSKIFQDSQNPVATTHLTSRQHQFHGCFSAGYLQLCRRGSTRQVLKCTERGTSRFHRALESGC